RLRWVNQPPTLRIRPRRDSRPTRAAAPPDARRVTVPRRRFRVPSGAFVPERPSSAASRDAHSHRFPPRYPVRHPKARWDNGRVRWRAAVASSSPPFGRLRRGPDRTRRSHNKRGEYGARRPKISLLPVCDRAPRCRRRRRIPQPTADLSFPATAHTNGESGLPAFVARRARHTNPEPDNRAAADRCDANKCRYSGRWRIAHPDKVVAAPDRGYPSAECFADVPEDFPRCSHPYRGVVYGPAATTGAAEDAGNSPRCPYPYGEVAYGRATKMGARSVDSTS